LVVDIAAVAEGVEGAEGGCHGAGGGNGVAPGVIAVVNDRRSAAVQNGNHITLQVGDIVVGSAVIGNGHRHTYGIIGKVQRVITHGHLTQATAVVDVAIGRASVCPLGAHTVGIIGIIPSGRATGHTCQLSAVFPSVGPSAVGKGVADSVVGYGLPVVAGEQVAP